MPGPFLRTEHTPPLSTVEVGTVWVGRHPWGPMIVAADGDRFGKRWVAYDGEIPSETPDPPALLTWRTTSGGTHVGSRNGADIVRIFEVNYGMEHLDVPPLFVANWDAPMPSNFLRGRHVCEWRSQHVEDRDDLLATAKAAQEERFTRWLSLMGLLPMEMLTIDPERGDRLVTASGSVEV